MRPHGLNSGFAKSHRMPAAHGTEAPLTMATAMVRVGASKASNTARIRKATPHVATAVTIAPRCAATYGPSRAGRAQREPPGRDEHVQDCHPTPVATPAMPYRDPADARPSTRPAYSMEREPSVDPPDTAKDHAAQVVDSPEVSGDTQNLQGDHHAAPLRPVQARHEIGSRNGQRPHRRRGDHRGQPGTSR